MKVGCEDMVIWIGALLLSYMWLSAGMLEEMISKGKEMDWFCWMTGWELPLEKVKTMFPLALLMELVRAALEVDSG